MSIQGSVNQLFTIGGSFAGMYGLLHPEIAQARQVKKTSYEAANQVNKGIEELPQSLGEMNEEQLNILEDKVNILTNTANKFIDKVRENPSLLKDKQIKKDYEELIKDPDLVDLKQVKQNIATQRENLSKKQTMKDFASKYQAQGWNIELASDKLKQEGMQKVNQRDAYTQRRKDKGDV